MGSYIQSIFNKRAEELLLEDVESFFSTTQEETAILEFKSGQVELFDIYKEVAAFLNTEGGLIIVGAPKETKEAVGKNKVVRCTGELTYSSFRNKDWLYQKIASNISPSPTSIRIKEFHSEQGAVYLLDIAQSVTPPHQVSDEGRYYIRMEAEAKPAPHGLVQALFDKRKKPKLSASISVKNQGAISDTVNVLIHNQSQTPADKASVIVEVYNVRDIKSHHPFTFYDDTLGAKFSFSINTDLVLVRVISLPINFTVVHDNKPYLISASFWSKNSDFDLVFWTYDPVKRAVINEGNFENSEFTILDALENL